MHMMKLNKNNKGDEKGEVDFSRYSICCNEIRKDHI